MEDDLDEFFDFIPPLKLSVPLIDAVLSHGAVNRGSRSLNWSQPPTSSISSILTTTRRSTALRTPRSGKSRAGLCVSAAGPPA
jgi:hypothetical protein